MALFTAWTMLMARLSGQDDMVIGVPAAMQPGGSRAAYRLLRKYAGPSDVTVGLFERCARRCNW